MTESALGSQLSANNRSSSHASRRAFLLVEVTLAMFLSLTVAAIAISLLANWSFRQQFIRQQLNFDRQAVRFRESLVNDLQKSRHLLWKHENHLILQIQRDEVRHYLATEDGKVVRLTSDRASLDASAFQLIQLDSRFTRGDMESYWLSDSLPKLDVVTWIDPDQTRHLAVGEVASAEKNGPLVRLTCTANDGTCDVVVRLGLDQRWDFDEYE